MMPKIRFRRHKFGMEVAARRLRSRVGGAKVDRGTINNRFIATLIRFWFQKRAPFPLLILLFKQIYSLHKSC